MPFLYSVLLRIVLKFLYPWLEAHIPKQLVDLIRQIVDYVLKSGDQKKAVDNLKKHCEGLFCASDTLKT